MTSLLADAVAPSGKPACRLQQSNNWQRLAYRLARRGARLQLAQVWEGDLNVIAEPRWDSKYEFRQLDAYDLCRLTAYPTNHLVYDTALRLADANHRCFAALDGPSLACYAWFAEHNIGPEDTMNIPLSLSADACYLFNAFAAPAYRGRGLYVSTARRALAEMCRSGKSQGLALIEYGNVASMRSHDRIGLRPQGWIVSLGRGGLSYRWYSSAARKCGFGDSRPHKIL